jgi:hypothetical protein
MRSTVETKSLVREIRLVFCRWTVPAMTTAQQRSAVGNGLMAALAAVQAGGKAGWDLQWFSSNAKPQPLCTALTLRSQGQRVRPLASGSELDLSPGVAPTAQLRLSRG